MPNIIIKIQFSLIIVVSSIALTTEAQTYYLDDGLAYVLSDSTYEDDVFFLDYNIANNPGTQIDLINGAEIRMVAAYNNSVINMSGGLVWSSLRADGFAELNMTGGQNKGYINAYGNSTVTMTGGTVGKMIHTYDNSIFTITGGSSKYYLFANGNSTVFMKGGTLGDGLYAGVTAIVSMTGGRVKNVLSAWGDGVVNMSGGVSDWMLTRNNGIIFLNGTDFKVEDLDGNVTDLVPGDYISDFSTLIKYQYDGNNADFYTGTITGVLADGSTLNNYFRIHKIEYFAGDGDIIIATPHMPISDAGMDIKLNANDQCGASVILDGSGSYDEDDDELTYYWFYNDEFFAEGIEVPVNLEIGTYVFTLIVNDGVQDSLPDKVIVTVVDETPPEFSISVDKSILWPPNKKMVKITPSFEVSDNCCGAVVIELVDITCNQRCEKDIEITDEGIFLRAIRDANIQENRIYTIKYKATDDSNNETIASVEIKVPHDHSE